MPIGSVASRGMSFAPGGYDSNQTYGELGKVIGMLGQSALYDPTSDPDAQRARLSSAQATEQETKNTSNAQVGDILAQLDQQIDSIKDNPELAAQNIKRTARQAVVAYAKSGGDPTDVAKSFLIMNQMITGHSNANSMDFNVAAGGGPVGADQSFTEGRQNELIGRKEDLATSLNAADNATSRANNTATIAGENQRFYNPAVVNTGAGETSTMFDQQGQPKRTISGAPTETTAKGGIMKSVADGAPVTPAISDAIRLGSSGNTPSLPFNAGGDIDAEIDAQPGGKTLDPELKTQIRAKASQYYQGGMAPTVAVQQAIKDLATPSTSSTWMGLGPDETTLGPKDLMAAPAASEGKGSSAAAPATVPPPAQRKPNTVYQTPKGPMIWTGTGWRPKPDA